ncbi:MAG: hypothetical protein HY724_02015 [Candidatus Rokubacteria bacterium]|nr:hypothetical protein [Candidatus Rokubacteria bacterium]
MRLAKRLLPDEVRTVCSVCGGDARHLCRRCREKATSRHGFLGSRAPLHRLPPRSL